MIAAMQAKNVEIVRVMIEGTFRAIRIPVTTGTISNQGVMLNLFSRLIATSVICSIVWALWVNPMMVNRMSVITSEGMVVMSM